MIGRTLRVLANPGIPFQPPAVKEVLHSLRSKVQVQVYDCQSQAEVFDSLGHFWPDCILLAGEPDHAGLLSLQRRAQELRSESLPVLLITDDQDAFADTPNVHTLARTSLSAVSLKSLLMAQASPRPVQPQVPLAEQSFRYEWMGKTTFTEEGAVRTLFSEERFRRLVDNALDLICVVEEDGFIKYASSSSERILGIHQQELAGHYVQDYLQKCKRNNIARWFARNRNRSGFTELRMRHTSGRPVYLEAACVDMTQDSAIRGFVISAREITARRETEEKLDYQARLLAHIREAVVGLDADSRIVYMNRAAERFYRHKLEDALGKPWIELCQIEWMHPDEESFATEALRDHGLWQGEVIQHLAHGRRSHVEVSMTAHREVESGGTSLIVVVRDIKDRKVVENVLHESENRYRNLVTVTSDLVWHTDADNALTFISPKVGQLLGYAPTEVLGKALAAFLAEPETAEAHQLQTALSNRQPFSYLQGTFRTRDGRLKYLEISGLPQMGTKRQHEGYHGAIRDVTERVEAERSLRQSLAEKETLIKEIHHRVKNNMQIVSSLLYLQTQFIKDPDMLARLQESQDRIRSMALVHEKLYQSRDLSRIDFKDYLETLARHISNSYRNRFVHLALELPEEPVSIGIDTAVPCGLVVNELVSNAYKHAFEPEAKGVVTLKLVSDGKRAELTISDTGKGLPYTDLGAYSSTSLGMQLVDALVHQLQGKLEVRNQDGAHFQLKFKL